MRELTIFVPSSQVGPGNADMDIARGLRSDHPEVVMYSRRCLGDAEGLLAKAKAFADAGDDSMAVKVWCRGGCEGKTRGGATEEGERREEGERGDDEGQGSEPFRPDVIRIRPMPGVIICPRHGGKIVLNERGRADLIRRNSSWRLFSDDFPH